MESKITQRLIEVCSTREHGQYIFDCYIAGMCRVWWDGAEWQAHLTKYQTIEMLEDVAEDLFHEIEFEFDEEVLA